MVKDTFEKFYAYAHRVYRGNCVKESNKHYFKLLRDNNREIKRLTKEQKKEVDGFWRGLVTDYSTHELYYSVTGKFDPAICSEMLLRTKLEIKLNDQELKRAWADKCCFEMFFPDFKFPRTVVRNIGGHFYDESYRLITIDKAAGIMDGFDRFVVKPSIDNGVGKGVELFERGAQSPKDVLLKYKADFVVQEVFKQHETLCRFSPRSVNVLRVISLFIGDGVRFISASLRASTSGAFNDNHITEDGRGMIVIGIDENGRLKDKAYYSCGDSTDRLDDGFVFAGTQIPNYGKIRQTVTAAHERLGHFGFVGWDVTIDESGEPVIMEYNIKSAGGLYYQYTNGPLFGEYTKEVIDWYLGGR